MSNLQSVSILEALPQVNIALPLVMSRGDFSLISGALSSESREEVARAFVKFQREVGGTVTAFSEEVAQELLEKNMLFRVIKGADMKEIQDGRICEVQCGFSIIPFPLQAADQMLAVRESIRLCRFGSLGVRIKQTEYVGDDRRQNDRRREGTTVILTTTTGTEDHLKVMRQRLLADRRGFGNGNWTYIFGLVAGFHELQQMSPFSEMDYLFHTNDSQENFARKYSFFRFKEVVESLYEKVCSQYNVGLDLITEDHRNLFYELAMQKLLTVYRCLDLGYSHDSTVHGDREGTGLMDYWMRFRSENMATKLFGHMLEEFLISQKILKQSSCVAHRKAS